MVNMKSLTPNEKVGSLFSLNSPMDASPLRKKVEILEYNKEKRFLGKLKFYNEARSYGFISAESEKDVFVHLEDLEKSGLTLQMLKELVTRRVITVSYCRYKYVGKDGKDSLKAVDLEIVQNELFKPN
jgi:hypothetical protein